MEMDKRVYEDCSGYSDAEIDRAIAQNDDCESLSRMVIAISLYHPVARWSVERCLALSNHRDPIVRGNAVLGFGHLARRFGKLDEATVRPIIERAIIDPDEYVRGQAWAAASDVTFFLGWNVERFHPRDVETDE